MSEVLLKGKSKVVRQGVCDDSLVIEFLDCVTAFNGDKKAEFVGKGALCAAISGIIFRHLEKHGIKTHLIKDVSETSVSVKKADIIPVEVVVRNKSAGGFAKKYGVDEGSSLKNVVVEFSYKSDTLGDPLMNESQITALGLADQSELRDMADEALKINQLLVNFFASVGIELADFKLEFGRYQDEIILCDEISPDSCRLWDIATGERLDKDRFRRDLGDLLEGYAEVFNRLNSR
ncbi:MAG: phosphoribosylaminoimidazolesuccinocarboxamide synthase [Defluviitaleaceae bacterium]|nr:phosphoribosylaminoimidazolesuccinocarboxamide synthase [Defluviitaleaceae bacterium]